MRLITEERFVRRLIDLCIRSGMVEFPKSDEDQHILLQSVALTQGAMAVLSEKQVGEILEHWISQIAQVKSIDHVSLRRRLVDTGYLVRSSDGSIYRFSPLDSRLHMFEPAIGQVNVVEVLKTAREEIARRRDAYQAKQRLGG